MTSGEDPASERAQALAARWQALIGAFTGGNSEVQKGLNRLYTDQQNWPSTFKKPYSDEAGAFICKAVDLMNEVRSNSDRAALRRALKVAPRRRRRSA